MTEGDYVSAETIAAELGIHVQTVQKYFREGDLPGRKVGRSWRTTRAAVDAWLTGAPAPAPTHPALVLEHAVVEPLETKA